MVNLLGKFESASCTGIYSHGMLFVIAVYILEFRQRRGCRCYLFCIKFLCESHTWLEVYRFRQLVCWLRLFRREVLRVSRDYPRVVVSLSSGYVYCSRNWEILSAECGGVHSIVKDRAKSVARRGSAFISWYSKHRLFTVQLFSSSYD